MDTNSIAWQSCLLNTKQQLTVKMNEPIQMLPTDIQIYGEANCFWTGDVFIYHEKGSGVKERKKCGCETVSVVMEWMEQTLAEVRASDCGDELVEAYYHWIVWWYNLSLSINPMLCPWFKFYYMLQKLLLLHSDIWWFGFLDGPCGVQQSMWSLHIDCI